MSKDIPNEQSTEQSATHLGYWGGFEIAEITEYRDDKFVLSFSPIEKNDGSFFTPRDIVISAHDREHAITPQPVDLKVLQGNRLDPIVEEILQLFSKYDVNIGAGGGFAEDISYVFKTTIESISNWRRTVEHAHWGFPEDLLKFHMLEEEFEKYKDTVIPNLRQKSEFTD